MVNISRGIAFLLFILIIACSDIRARHANANFNVSYDLEVLQNHQEKYFEVKLKSKSNRNICIEYSQWPREDGLLHGPSGRAKIITKDEVILSITHNFGHCNKGLCAFVVPPGQSILGKISYENFILNNSQKQNEKLRLEFTVEPWSSDKCENQREPANKEARVN